jgi:hypothetical protein
MTHPRLLAIALPREPRIGIRRRGMRRIRAPLAVKVDRRIPRPVAWGRISTILSLRQGLDVLKERYIQIGGLEPLPILVKVE